MKLDTLYPDPESKGGPKGGPVGFRSLRGAFGKNFIKQKLLGTPNTVGVGHFFGCQIHIWKNPGLLCASGAVLLHFQEEFITQ